LKKPNTKPTDAELEILAALWQLGPSSVADVHEVLRERRDVGYTTILKMLQIMHEKGLVQRDESKRQHVYRPAASESVTQRNLMRDLVDRVFAGSAHKLVMHALSAKRATPNELKEIRKLLDELEGKSK
jgi:BlaI family transcriptional regulator, penicillinase repressor